MASDNTVTLVGNITDDPELRFTPSGAAVASFTVAVNRRFRNNDGQWEDKLDGFFRCNCWREMAENAAESLKKGTRVMVVGRLQQRSWDDQEGHKRSQFEVLVDEVGPSLRWSVASVQKSQRSGGRAGGSWGQEGGGAQGGGQQGGAPQGGGSWGAPQGDQGSQGGQGGSWGAPSGGSGGSAEVGAGSGDASDWGAPAEPRGSWGSGSSNDEGGL